jgi:hypothetical protein
MQAMAGVRRAADPGRQGTSPTTRSSTGRSATSEGTDRRSPRPTWSRDRAALPAVPPLTDRDLRVDRRLRPIDREAHRLHDDPGATHHPRCRGDGRRAARAHDPHHLSDIGGGFGNKVPVYPGYVVSILASILTERPVKWIEDKTGNLISTGFGRDIYLKGELALRKDGQDPRRADAHHLRPRRVLLRRPAEQVQDRADALGVRLLRHPRPPT